MMECTNDTPRGERNFPERVKKMFPTIEIIPENKFKCSCGHTGALNGHKQMWNIKWQVNTTCRLSGNHVGCTLTDYFHKNLTNEEEKQN